MNTQDAGLNADIESSNLHIPFQKNQHTYWIKDQTTQFWCIHVAAGL